MARKKSTRPQAVKNDNAKTAKRLRPNAAQLAEFVATALVAVEQLGVKKKPLEHFWLSPAQREVLLAVPEISKSIKAKLAKNKASFTVAEVVGMTIALAETSTENEPRKQIAVLLVAKHLVDKLQEGITDSGKVILRQAKEPKTKADSKTIYQFKITLKESKPPIWRRIQVKDCTLDKLHEHIQTAMGWTNSHLHHFKIGEQLYGDPMLMEEDFKAMAYKNSTKTKISKIVPGGGKPFGFFYEYDFGDSWTHEVLFEGHPPVQKGQKYPQCLEGARACPPEDVGGMGGYDDFLEAIHDKTSEERAAMFEWVSGWFDPEEFDPEVATKSMKKGLPDWRK